MPQQYIMSVTPIPPSSQDSNPNMACFLISSPRRSRNSMPSRGQTLVKRNKYWWRVTGRVLSMLLIRSSYLEDTRTSHDDFFKSFIVPLLGPTPDEYGSSQPVSFMCDDKTPVEIGWVFKSTGETSVQYAIEALSPSDGSPISPRQNLDILQHLSEVSDCQGFDLSWTHKCTQSLLYPSHLLSHDLQRVSQFFIGKRPHLVRKFQSAVMLTSIDTQVSTLRVPAWV